MNDTTPPPIVPAGLAIENDSFAHIDAHAGDRGVYSDAEWTVVRRLIHTSGDFEFNGITRFHPEAVNAAIAAFGRSAPILVDVSMIRAGLTPRRLKPLGVEVHHFISDPQVIVDAKAQGTTRAVQAMRHARNTGLLEGGIVAVGNAPTALLEVLRMVREENIKPALIVGIPVGFISAAESKDALMRETGIPWMAVSGTKGGSTLTVAALHALMDLTLISQGQKPG